MTAILFSAQRINILYIIKHENIIWVLLSRTEALY